MAGDHTLYIGHVEYLETDEMRPLLFYSRNYRTLDPESKRPMEAWLDYELFLFEPDGRNVGIRTALNAKQELVP